MTRFPVALAAGALLLVTAACGGGGEDEPAGSASPAASPSASESSPSGGSAAGECAGDTQVIEGADGVTLTVPADWTVESFGDGEDTRYASGDGDTAEGQLVVQANGQTIEEGVADVERLNSAQQKDSEDEVELPGFDDARVLQFTGEQTGSTGSYVVGVAGEVRTIAYVIVEDTTPEQAAAAFGCMLTLQR